LAVNNMYSVRNDLPEGTDPDLYLRVLQQRNDLLREAGIETRVFDSRDYHALSRAAREADPQVLVHLAAVAHADRSNKDPHSTFDHSLGTLENSLDVSRSKNLGIEHLVYFSSSMVYGNFAAESVTEDTPCEPLGIYGALKFAGEKMVIAYNQVFDVPYTIVRPSALYGERCISRRVGQIFIENALRGQDVRINGDGSDRLDFTYIRDLVEGVVKVIEHGDGGSRNEIFNLTYGESRSIAQMADILAAEFPNIRVEYLPKDKLVPKRGTLSVEKARRLIGYAPAWPLERGFPEYIRWYRSIEPAASLQG
ncbi:MAG: NAD(P)-dependent oxidoreductase, partial [Gemmatimonadota bacterium]|nr:NAD(P)-dependent oxidoreductase [Gemmatimonadota bacterium]